MIRRTASSTSSFIALVGLRSRGLPRISNAPIPALASRPNDPVAMQHPIHGIHAHQTIAFQHDISLEACFAIAKVRDLHTRSTSKRGSFPCEYSQPRDPPKRISTEYSRVFFCADGRLGTSPDRVFRDAYVTFPSSRSRRTRTRTDSDVEDAPDGAACTTPNATNDSWDVTHVDFLQSRKNSPGKDRRWDVLSLSSWFVELRRASTRRCARLGSAVVQGKPKRGG